MTEELANAHAAPVEWSVVWDDSRMPESVRENRASCRDEADARMTAEACARNSYFGNIRIQTRAVTTTPWTTTEDEQTRELVKVTADRDRLAGLYEAATIVLAGHLNANCSMVAQVRDRASASENPHDETCHSRCTAGQWHTDHADAVWECSRRCTCNQSA